MTSRDVVISHSVLVAMDTRNLLLLYNEAAVFEGPVQLDQYKHLNHSPKLEIIDRSS